MDGRATTDVVCPAKRERSLKRPPIWRAANLASTLNEIASASAVGFVLEESSISVPPDVAAACEMLGLDPLYVANEGVLAAIVPAECSDAAIGALRSHPLGAAARAVGQVVAEHPGLVILRTAIGGTRIVDLLPGDQLPRIC